MEMWFFPAHGREHAILPGEGGRAHRPSLEREGSSLTRLGWTFDSYQDSSGKANGSQPWGWYLALPTCASFSGPRLAPGSIHPFLLGLLTLTHPPKHPQIPLSTHFILHLSRAHTSIYPPVHPVCIHMHPAPVQPFIQLPILWSTHSPSTFSCNHPPIQLVIHLFSAFSHLSVNPHPPIYYSPLYPSIPTHLFTHVLTHDLFVHPSIIYVSIHHFIPPLTHPHMDPFFLAPIYIPINVNVNPLSPIYST